MAQATTEIVVVGGGIGGVAMALALGRQGRRVQLLEQSQEIAPIGYGVQIGPNVLPLLDQLGIGEAARKAAYLPPEILLYDAYTEQRLAHVPLRDAAFDQLFRHPYIAIHRVDLHEILLAACREHANIEMVEACTVTGFSQTAEAVQVQAADGRSFTGQALIAADGLRSRIRAQLFPDDAPRDTGYVAYRSIIPMAAAPASLRQRPGVTMWSGDGFHVIYYPLRNGTELNMVGVFRVEPPLGPEADPVAQLRQATANCRPEVRDVLAHMNLERRWSIADREPLRRWGEGRVTLLGDSAHATLQSLAQGAGMAVEDVAVLARLIEGSRGDYPGAFARFQRLRLTRTARVQLQSRTLWQEYHCGGIAAQVRNQEWSERTEADFLRCLQWLWNPIATDTDARA
jgi:2-polyprenyl-6-methoxyphenol hydroxylase-like FAD-dependent oxidoreductase